MCLKLVPRIWSVQDAAGCCCTVPRTAIWDAEGLFAAVEQRMRGSFRAHHHQQQHIFRRPQPSARHTRSRAHPHSAFIAQKVLRGATIAWIVQKAIVPTKAIRATHSTVVEMPLLEEELAPKSAAVNTGGPSGMCVDGSPKPQRDRGAAVKSLHVRPLRPVLV